MANTLSKTYRFTTGFGEAEITQMRQDVARQMHDAGVPGDSAYAFINVLDEFCCNMMEHASGTWFEIAVEPKSDAIAAVLKDDGVEFDPTEAISHVDPEHPANVTDRRLGLYMIGLMAKDLKYARQGDVNRLEFSLKR